MPILAVVGLLFQVLFAVHAVKTSRDRYWLYIIIFFPGVGCLIYFFAEYLPYLQENRGLQRFSAKIDHTLNPGKLLCQLQQQVELTPSVKNKKALAEAYVHSGMFDQAIPLFQSCMEGESKNDPYLLEGLSCAYFFKEDFVNAKRYLILLLDHCEPPKAGQFQLLLARTFEALGDIDAARQKYDQVVKTLSGEEARCRYALLLKKLGATDEANALFDEILRNARLSPKYYRKTQKVWLDIAKKEKA